MGNEFSEWLKKLNEDAVKATEAQLAAQKAEEERLAEIKRQAEEDK